RSDRRGRTSISRAAAGLPSDGECRAGRAHRRRGTRSVGRWRAAPQGALSTGHRSAEILRSPRRAPGTPGLPQGRGHAMKTRTQPVILIAEDFEDARDLYKDYLEFSGFAVETARNGREAIDLATSLKPDLILMDASMPVLDGWQATRELKANPVTRHIPLLALTPPPSAPARHA